MKLNQLKNILNVAELEILEDFALRGIKLVESGEFLEFHFPDGRIGSSMVDAEDVTAELRHIELKLLHHYPYIENTPAEVEQLPLADDNPSEETEVVTATAEISIVQTGIDNAPIASLFSTILLERIRTDGGTQTRAEINMLTVTDYAEAMRAGVIFPPVILFYDGADYWLADGFHRVMATKEAGLLEIACDVREGTQRDAILYSLGANATHGLPRTNADKRRAVEMLLTDSEWSKWSDTRIAEKACVTQPFVSKVRRELSESGVAMPTERIGKSGTTIDTTGIGKKTKAAIEETKADNPELFDEAKTNPLEETNTFQEAKEQGEELKKILPPSPAEETKPTPAPEAVAAVSQGKDPEGWSKKTVRLVIDFKPTQKVSESAISGSVGDGMPEFGSVSVVNGLPTYDSIVNFINSLKSNYAAEVEKAVKASEKINSKSKSKGAKS